MKVYSSSWNSTSEPLATWYTFTCHPAPAPAGDFSYVVQRQMTISTPVSTASADPPDISARQVPPLTSFEPVTEKEVLTLLTNSPAKS